MSAPTTNTTIHSIHISNVSISIAAPVPAPAYTLEVKPSTPDACNAVASSADAVCNTAEPAPVSDSRGAKKPRKSGGSRSTSRSRKR